MKKTILFIIILYIFIEFLACCITDEPPNDDISLETVRDEIFENVLGLVKNFLLSKEKGHPVSRRMALVILALDTELVKVLSAVIISLAKLLFLN